MNNKYFNTINSYPYVQEALKRFQTDGEKAVVKWLEETENLSEDQIYKDFFMYLDRNNYIKAIKAWQEDEIISCSIEPDGIDLINYKHDSSVINNVSVNANNNSGNFINQFGDKNQGNINNNYPDVNYSKVIDLILDNSEYFSPKVVEEIKESRDLNKPDDGLWRSISGPAISFIKAVPEMVKIFTGLLSL